MRVSFGACTVIYATAPKLDSPDSKKIMQQDGDAKTALPEEVK
ncbi:hypothetical protein CPter291_0567 [Collimonas pratensis]|uniref:Lipoprotein n=1 Tax=Collimonas pratensis TaxID=279113 RepID=A0A127QS45_9BURK|nr:hypothetical protein CPter91_0631 [Collimonas pratensis]AMP12853.1 hypothetical protein CPter291_0567 [Collimonas pratensis]